VPGGVAVSEAGRRWAEGVPHDPRTLEICNALRRIDFEQCGDYFGWKFGGDGDNGETLAYELDVYFAEKDAAP
jgi:hypothetical protein